MIKAGITALGVILLLLFAHAPTHAASPEDLGLLNARETHNTCESPLKPYIFSFDKNCEVVKQRQQQAENIVKTVKVEEEFLIAHSYEVATYTPTTASEPTPTPFSITPEATLAESSPAPTSQPALSQGNNPDVIFNLINEHRAKIGKSPFIKDANLCSLAQTRSGELGAELYNGTLHSGLYNRNLPYWITENAKVGGDETETVRWWLNSGIHRAAIEGDYTYSCGGCTGNHCAQLFTNYSPKNYPITSSNTETK